MPVHHRGLAECFSCYGYWWVGAGASLQITAFEYFQNKIATRFSARGFGGSKAFAWTEQVLRSSHAKRFINGDRVKAPVVHPIKAWLVPFVSPNPSVEGDQGTELCAPYPDRGFRKQVYEVLLTTSLTETRLQELWSTHDQRAAVSMATQFIGTSSPLPPHTNP